MKAVTLVKTTSYSEDKVCQNQNLRDQNLATFRGKPMLNRKNCSFSLKNQHMINGITYMQTN